LAHTFASPCLGREPKVRVVTDTFSYDLVTFIILCTSDLYVMYVDPLKRYNHPQFAMFNDLVQNVCDVVHVV
jgi:hypothetical protein